MAYVSIDGPAGNIEGQFEQTDSEVCAVLCHPHPLYGGTMDDMVVGALNAALTKAGASTLRFNFRGVGASTGAHDKGKGEVADVQAVVDWIRQQTQCTELLLAGYSFGAGIALSAAKQCQCDKLLLVAPPVMMLEAQDAPTVPTLVILGETDQIINAEEATRWFEKSGAVTEVIPGADHFFFGAHEQISALANKFVTGS